MREISREFGKLLDSAEILKVKNSNLAILDSQAQAELNNNYRQRRKSVLNKEDEDDFYMK